MMNIIFYGPIGGKKGSIIGGGESGNRKTISILKDLGYNIIIIEKPYPLTNKILRMFVYPFQLLNVFSVYFIKIVCVRQKTFHLSGFYNHLIYFEFILIFVAKLLNIKSVYEIRAGGAIECYTQKSIIYQYFFRKTVKNASYVLCQGQEYVYFLKQKMDINGLYYPNFIQDDIFQPYSDNGRTIEQPIKLVYFGRIVPSKNIEFIIEICKHLKAFDFTCEIIGGGEVSYINKLKNIIDDYDLTNNIIFTPPQSSSALMSTLQDKHFFLFPSKEKREGHSNSLTEAMSAGVVPLVSKAGFNSSIVQNSFLVVDLFDANLYAAKVISIWNAKTWSIFSSESYSIVEKNFTSKAVRSVLQLTHSR